MAMILTPLTANILPDIGPIIVVAITVTGFLIVIFCGLTGMRR